MQLLSLHSRRLLWAPLGLNVKTFSIMLTERIYDLRMIFSINSHCFPTQN